MVKLAFWDTVNGAYRFVFSHPLMVVRTGWLYLALTALDVSLRSGLHEPLLRAGSFATGILLIGASIAWHIALLRAILLGEHSWTAALQFGYRHWRLLGVGVLLFLMLLPIAAVEVMIGFAAFHAGRSAFAIFIVVAAVGAVPLAVVGCRLYLLSPAIALDDPAKAIRAAWRRGRHNSWRLFFGDVLMIVPAVIVAAMIGGGGGLIVFIAAHGDTSLGAWIAHLGFAGRAVLGLGQGVIQLVVSALSVTFYAFAFRQLAANWSPPPALVALQLDT